VEFSNLYRKKETDFSRDRILPFWQVLMLILSGHKISLQNALNKVFKAFGRIFQVPTASAYCQARQKIKAEVFVHLNESVSQDFYQLYGGEEKVKLWHGHRLLGADGTYLNLPDTKSLRKAFGVHRNQHKGEKQATVQALSMVLYDLLNDLGLRGALGRGHSAEKSLLFEQLWGELKIGDVLVLDRNSADYTIIGKAVKGCDSVSATEFQSGHGIFCESGARANRDVKCAAECANAKVCEGA
jgi:hypothetical protein